MSRSRATEVSTGKKLVSPGQQGKIAGLAVVVMAAGLGKRMRSKQAKVLHQVAGQAMGSIRWGSDCASPGIVWLSWWGIKLIWFAR